MLKRNQDKRSLSIGKTNSRYNFVPGTSRPRRKPPKKHEQLLVDVSKCLRDAGRPMFSRDIADTLAIRQTHARSLVLKLVNAGVARQADDRLERIRKGFFNKGWHTRRIHQWEMIPSEELLPDDDDRLPGG